MNSFEDYIKKVRYRQAYLYFNAEMISTIKELKDKGLTWEEIEVVILDSITDEELLAMDTTTKH